MSLRPIHVASDDLIQLQVFTDSHSHWRWLDIVERLTSMTGSDRAESIIRALDRRYRFPGKIHS